LQPRLSSHPAAPTLTGPLPRHSYTAAYHQHADDAVRACVVVCVVPGELQGAADGLLGA
jgi:hypothetical protein